MSARHPDLDRELASPDTKKNLNLELFSEIAKEYDFITRALSFCQDAGWKRDLLQRLRAPENPVCVDLACGTGDITMMVAEKFPQGSVTGIDLTPEMVEIANRRNNGKHSNASFQVGDMGNLNAIADASVDIVTGGYAIRNAPDLEQALREVYRILKPGGIAAFLDFSRSANPLLSQGSFLTLKIWGGFWGLVMHGRPYVYGYIANSLKSFPNRRDLGNLFQKVGFVVEHRQGYMGGLMETNHLVKPA